MSAVDCGGCAPPVQVADVAPVGVLAVLDAEIASLPEIAALAGIPGVSCDPTEAIARLTEARAAVDELIRKADNAARILHNVIAAGQIGAGYQTNLDDLTAALARAGGAA